MYLGLNRSQTFSCREGKIKVLYHFGVIAGESTNKAYCGTNTIPEIARCNQYIDHVTFSQHFTERCIGREKCSEGLNLREYVS